MSEQKHLLEEKVKDSSLSKDLPDWGWQRQPLKPARGKVLPPTLPLWGTAPGIQPLLSLQSALLKCRSYVF